MGAAPNDPRGTCRCGLLDDELLSFSEERRLPYIVVARMTKWVQSAAQRVEQWPEVDENYAVGESAYASARGR